LRAWKRLRRRLRSEKSGGRGGAPRKGPCEGATFVEPGKNGIGKTKGRLKLMLQT